MSQVRFWPGVPLVGVAVALIYLPTLSAPFDFTDDGNLVYPTPQASLAGYVQNWWGNVRANAVNLGPFRPTLWAHWELQSNLLGADPLAWRLVRGSWTAAAAAMLYWLMRLLGAAPLASFLATLAAIANPYRSEIWTSLTLGEGVAAPYALFALVAARRAATSPRAWCWDLAGMAAALMALGCKNTFIAIIPAQFLLRLWPDGVPLRTAIREHGLRAFLVGLTALAPIAHYIHFKMNWQPGQYQTQPPNLDQLIRMLKGLKGALALDFLGAGMLAALAAVIVPRGSFSSHWPGSKSGVCAMVVLLLGGIVVYLPMDAISPRYTMPAVWGLDVLLALLLSRTIEVVSGWRRVTVTALFVIGLGAVLISNVGKQLKFAIRNDVYWDLVHHLETDVPRDAVVEWDGKTLPVEDAIHVLWHLQNRGRNSVRWQLTNVETRTSNRELFPGSDRHPTHRIDQDPGELPGWIVVRRVERTMPFGRVAHWCHIRMKSVP